VWLPHNATKTRSVKNNSVPLLKSVLLGANIAVSWQRDQNECRYWELTAHLTENQFVIALGVRFVLKYNKDLK